MSQHASLPLFSAAPSASVVPVNVAGAATAQASALMPTRFLAVANGRIAFDDTGGAGPVILAIPGMGDLRSQYRHLRPWLQAAGYRVVTMDVRGCGETSVRWSDYSAHAVGRDALAVLEHLGAGPAVVLGNSFAAGAALWAAHEAPTRIRGSVLLGPIVRDLPQSRLVRMLLRVAFAGPWRVRAWLAYWDGLFPTRKPLDQDRAKAALARNLREPGRMAALWTMINVSKARTQALLPHSRVPALVMMGSRDVDFPDAAAEAHALGTLLRARTVIVEGAGHYPHTEMPERVAPAVLAFIAALPDR